MNNYDQYGIFKKEYQEHRKYNRMSKSLITHISEYFNKDYPVYDFGCGNGEYLYELQKQGFTVFGYEGTPGINEISVIPITEHNLTIPLDKPKQTGNVMCIEVLEHIPKQYENVIVNTLIKHTKEKLVISWAVRGQSGVGHVNTQNSDYVIPLFESKGFLYNDEESRKWRYDASKDFPWFANSLYAFRLT